jgi:DNA polymerase III delta prime subunit
VNERVLERECVDIAARISCCAATGSRPHHLLVGPCGVGKSTALASIVDKVAAAVHADALLIVKLAPDGYGIASYRDLLAEIVWAIGGRAIDRRGTVWELQERVQAAAGDRAVLLVIDNLDRVFDRIGGNPQMDGGGGQGAFRGWIETWEQAMILGSASTVSDWFRRRDYPWFGSFNIVAVDPFTAAQARDYLARMADGNGDLELAAAVRSAAGRAACDALYGYFGGIPRHWAMLGRAVTARMLLADPDSAVGAVCDHLVPYHRMVFARMAPGQQRLLHELALADEPLTVTELARRLGVTNQSAATTLGRMSAARIVQADKPVGADRRRTWYAIADRLLAEQVRYLSGRGVRKGRVPIQSGAI